MQVTLSRNDGQGMLSAAWEDEPARYSVSGGLTEEELLLIVQGLMEP